MNHSLLDPRNNFVFKTLFAKSRALLSDLINVEIQMRQREKWSTRSMVYLAKTLGTQLKAGVDYAKLKPVIGIHLLGYDLFPEQNQACWCFEMRDGINPAVKLGSELQLYIVELAKWDRLNSGGNQGDLLADGLSALAAWIKYFQHWKEPSIMNQIAYPPVRRAMRRLKAISGPISQPGEHTMYQPSRFQVSDFAAMHQLMRAQPWRVAEAPPEYIDKLVTTIVGLELVIGKITGKFKMSQNQNARTQASVVTGLQQRGDAAALAVAAMVQQINQTQQD